MRLNGRQRWTIAVTAAVVVLLLAFFLETATVRRWRLRYAISHSDGGKRQALFEATRQDDYRYWRQYYLEYAREASLGEAMVLASILNTDLRQSCADLYQRALAERTAPKAGYLLTLIYLLWPNEGLGKCAGSSYDQCLRTVESELTCRGYVSAGDELHQVNDP
jgi:hypothetical protein